MQSGARRHAARVKLEIEIDYDERGWTGRCPELGFDHTIDDLGVEQGFREPEHVLACELRELASRQIEGFEFDGTRLSYTEAAQRERSRRLLLHRLAPPGAAAGPLEFFAASERTGELLEQLAEDGSDRAWAEARREQRLRQLDAELAQAYVALYSPPN